MPYMVDLTAYHKQSFIDLVNFDNSGTIGAALTLANTNLISERAVDKVGEGIDRDYAITLENVAYPADNVEVYWNKIGTEEVTTMTQAGGDLDWYNPEWVPGTSEGDAVAAYKAALTRDGVDWNQTLEGISVVRTHNVVENRYYLEFSHTSMVFKETATFELPGLFADNLTNTDLNGFIYSAIQPEDVVA